MESKIKVDRMIDYPQPYIHAYYWAELNEVGFYSRNEPKPHWRLETHCVAIFKIRYHAR